MSRVGLRILNIPEGVEVKLHGHKLTVKGGLGELHREFSDRVKIIVEEKTIKVSAVNSERKTKMLHGTTNSLIAGMLEGVTKGFTKHLEIVGVGYNAKTTGQVIELTLGYSHKIKHHIPTGIKIEQPTPTEIILKGIDKQLVGLHASQIKKYRQPEPYGGKGIRYKGEHIRRKAGKAAAK